MDWSKIVKVLTANGFTGDGSDLAAVKAFAETEVGVANEDGTTIDLDAAFAAFGKKAKRTVVVPSVDVDAMKAENAKLREQARKAASAAAMTGGGTDDGQAPQTFKIGNVAAKAYDRRAKEGRGKTAFSTAEEAEMFGALVATELLPGRATKAMREIADSARKANITTTNTSGGFTIPEVFMPSLIDLKELRGAARQVLSVLPASRDNVTMPRRTGGVTVYWPGEGGNITESNPTGNDVQVTANKMTAITRLSNELLNDSAIAFGDFVAREIAYAFADKEDEAVFNGDGTSTYGGHTGFREKIKGLSGTIANIAGLTVGSGNAYSEAALIDFEAVVGNSPAYVNNPYWIMHKATFWATAGRLMLAAGGVTYTELANGIRTPMLLGYPVVFAQVMPRVEANSQVYALFGDFNLAAKAIEVAGGMQLATDTGGDNFTADVTAFRGVNRFGVTIHDVGNASATAASRIPGPVVGLITAAS